MLDQANAAVKKAATTPYDRTDGSGIINLGLAESHLMHNELVEFFQKSCRFDAMSHLTYGVGANGSPRFRRAITSFFNTRFNPVTPVEGQHFLVTSGVRGLLDGLTWCLCDDQNEGILVPQPLYSGFEINITRRSRGALLPVSFLKEGYNYNVDDVFDPDANAVAFENALSSYGKRGIKARAVLLTNPHNPLGRCYTVETIVEVAKFCAKHNLHLLCDEIYANSTFVSSKHGNLVDFTSILSIDLKDIINPDLVHVLYGMSKDFCANGLRLGVLQTRNKLLLEAMGTLNSFGWPPYITQDLWVAMLEDSEFLENFITTNQKRLAESYDMFTSLLESHGISYLHGG